MCRRRGGRNRAWWSNGACLVSLVMTSSVHLTVIGSAFAADCNANGVQDSVDIADGTSDDCNGNGVPDECDVSSLAFASAADYAVGVRPFALAAADLDGDQHLDLAVVNSFSDTASVLVNNGDGTFGVPALLAVGDGPHSVAAADVDGDRDVDLAVANSGDDTVSILLNNGHGTFAAPANYAVGGFPNAVVAADLDDDGAPDLAVANESDDSVSVLLNAGNGTYGVATNFAVCVVPTALTAVDVDGDGDFDLAVANSSKPGAAGQCNNVSVLLNNGSGSFGPAQDYPAGDGPSGIASGHLDGDGAVDLAVANRGDDTVSVLWNNGSGAFSTPDDFSVADSPASVAIGDLDGDGNPDLVVANAGFGPDPSTDSTIISVLLRGGSVSRVDLDVGLAPVAVVVADLDDDDRLDLAVVNYGGNSVSVLLNRTPAQNELDCNANGVPDECESDRDGDGVIDDCDNCPDVANADQADADGDGVGDACEPACCGASGPITPLGLAAGFLLLNRPGRQRKRAR